MSESAIQTREQRLDVFLAEPTHRLFTNEVSGQHFLEYPQFNGRVAVAVASDDFANYAGFWFRQKHKRRLDEKELRHLAADVADRCRFEKAPPPRRFFLRTAKHDGTLYLDLADGRRRVIAVDAGGWRLAADCPVSFQRTGATSALPMPEHGGRLDDLWPLLPKSLTPQQRMLLLGWLLAAFDPSVEQPLLVLCGPAGSGKSSVANILRSIIDPSAAGLGGGLPATDRDLRVAMSNSWAFTVDNLSKLTPSQSDTFCQRVTGGVLRARGLFTDCGEVIRPIEGPSIMTCISNVVEQADLLSRSLVLEMPELADGDRRSKNAVFAEFERLRPKLLGMLLDMLAAGMRVQQRPELAATSRLADVLMHVEGCFEGAGLPPGSFAQAVAASQNACLTHPLDAWLVAEYLFARFDKPERVTAGELLLQLTDVAKEYGHHRHPDWPKTPATFARQLRQNLKALRAQGLEVKLPTSHSGKGKLYHFAPVDVDVAEVASKAGASDTAAAMTAA